MAKRFIKEDYREKHPGLSDQIVKVLEQSDRKMEYQQYDLKIEHYRVDFEKKEVICIPSREDSYERLLEEKWQFAATDESVEDSVIKNMLIEKLNHCIDQLPESERLLIQNLYFHGKTQGELAKEIGITQQSVSSREKKICAKLKKMMEK